MTLVKKKEIEYININIMTNFSVEVEKQQLIVNINMMRQKIGVKPSDFNYLWAKDVEWLRNEQENTINHYNEAIKNK